MSTSFKVRFALVLAALVTFVCFIGVLLTISGPRLSRVTTSFTPGQEFVTLHFSEQLDPTIMPTITSSPQSTFSPFIEREQLIIRFNEPLRYSTDYTIFVSQLSDIRGKTSSVTAQFRTSEPQMYLIERRQAEPDRIMLRKLYDPAIKEIYSHETILDYAVSSLSMLVVVEEKAERLLLEKRGETVRTVEIPAGKRVAGLDGSVTADDYFLLLQDTSSFATTLHRYSFSSGLTEITTADGLPLQVSSFQFAPDGKSVVYRATSGISFIDNFDDQSAPLSIGEIEVLTRFLPDSSGIFGFTQNSFVTLDAASGELQKAPESTASASQAQQFMKRTRYTTITQALQDDLTLGQTISLTDHPSQPVPLATEETSERLFLQLQLSPNDEFIITEEASQPVLYDGYAMQSRPVGVQTIFRTTDGSILDVFDGFDIIWR